MKNPYVILTVSAALIFASCKKSIENDPGTVQPSDCISGRAATDGNVIQGKYIVTYSVTGSATKTMSAEKMADLGRSTLERNEISTAAIEKTFAGEPAGFVAALTEEQAVRLEKDAAVAIVEPDRIIALNTCFTVVEPRLVTWNVNRVGYGDGTGKTAWVIDSGIDLDHPDLNVDVSRSRSFVNGQTSPDDQNGHGTHVAGIIGAKNNSIGVLGVASGAKLVSLRVLGADGEGTLSSIIQALAYVNANGAPGDVVNLSLGEEGVSATLDQQVQNTAAHGIFVAIAAGNDGKPARECSPGRANGNLIYTVSATDSLDRFASFSNYGNDVVDVAAPGVSILSTYMNDRYAIMSGTSMATPHVAGLLLLKGKNITTSGVANSDPDGTPDGIAHY